MQTDEQKGTFGNLVLMAGYIFHKENELWQNHLSRVEATCQQEDHKKYHFRMANNNFDAQALVSGTTIGMYDGLELKSKVGLLLENIPDNLPLTTGLAAYWDPQKQTLTLISSPASSRRMFYRILPEGVVFSSDARLLMRDGDAIDILAAVQLVVYSATSGTRSPFTCVKSVPLGFMAKFNLGKNQITEELLPVLKYKWEPQDVSEDQIDTTLDTIRDSLMGVLEQISQHKTAVLLSGGIDSSLLACLLKNMRVKDVQMFTCGFSKDDLDVQYATQLAKKLGYSHTVIILTDDEALRMLDECPRAYSMPFNDYSTIPSYFFIKKIVALTDKGTYLLDGTAGDALFGLGGLKRTSRNRCFWKIPHFIKRLGSQGYYSLGLWQDRRFCSRAIGAVIAAIVPHPALIGIMHTRCAGRLSVGTDEILTGGEELLKYAMKILHGKDFSDEVLLTILDLVHICSGLFCNKVADPARYLGCAVEFPFMWPELVQVGLSIPYWLQNYQSQLKYPLKQLLTHYVGADYVNRPKTGFTPPLSRWLPQPDFNAKFQEVVGKSYLLRDTLGKTPVEKMVKAALGNPRYFQEHAYNLMWGVFFTEQWFTCARKLHLPVASKQ